MIELDVGPDRRRRKESKTERIGTKEVDYFEWIDTMQGRYHDYPHLYSGPYFAPKLAAVTPAPILERVAYWLGAALVWIALPLTLPAALYLSRRVRKLGLVR